MNLYDTEEIERINKARETNDKLEDFFASKRDTWNKNMDPLYISLRDNFTIDNSQKIIEIQSLALSYRQVINEEISLFLNKRTKEEVKMKKLKQDKFVFYATIPNYARNIVLELDGSSQLSHTTKCNVKLSLIMIT